MITGVQENSTHTRAKTLHQHFLEVREMSLKITRPLSAEDQMLQSMPDASPAKWHLAHTTWFFETFILEPNVPGYTPFDPRFKVLFNSYYKQLGAHPNRGSRGLMSRPSLEQVHQYRALVDQAISDLVGDSPGEEILELIELGLNHEQQHQELILTDIKHAFWSSPLRAQPAHDTTFSIKAPHVTWIPIEGGIHSVGHEGNDFAFDNERPRHDVLLRPFHIACRAVTNAEYMEFMADGGYRRPQMWLSDGWEAVCANQWNSPLYWERRDDDSWSYFDGAALRHVEPSAPVCHVSFYEADAFARWSGARLPTEEEWEVTASRYPSRGTLLEDEVFHPRPAEGDGFQQAFGDVWEWTASPYVAYPGFTPAEGLLGEYNGKFMCNQLVLRGGSCATPASHIRPSYRNFFPAHARWQFSGIRLAK